VKVRRVIQSLAANLLKLLSISTVYCVSTAFAADYEHPGYLDTIEDERYEITREVYIAPPLPDPTPSLR